MSNWIYSFLSIVCNINKHARIYSNQKNTHTMYDALSSLYNNICILKNREL